MVYTYEELKKKTVNELREVAKEIEHDAVKGYSQMNKEHLIGALCNALSIDMRVHHHVVGINKTSIKGQILALKKQRDAQCAAHQYPEMHATLRQIHQLKRKLRKFTV